MIAEESKSEALENDGIEDPTFSPPLARQLFSKHGLFENEDAVIDKSDRKFPPSEWFPEEPEVVASP